MRNRISVKRCLCQVVLLGFFFLGSLSSSAAVAESLAKLQQQWALTMYQAPAEARKPMLGELVEQVRLAAAANTDDASLQVWKGIILSTLAGERGGLGALSLAKEAKAALEAALVLDPDGLDGSAATSLGALYHQVPGWPIGFGNDKKALQLLEQGLAANPQGIDANYFLAQYWFDKGRPQVAKKYLQIAQRAPSRPGRELADSGRQKEIQSLLETIGGSRS